jgi:hypothetical protein
MENATEAPAIALPTAVAARRGVRCAAIIVLLVVGSTGASAQEGPEYRGTQDQQMACTGDVFRLCWSEIPNVSRIVGCLVREKPRLTAACRAVFVQNSPRTASSRWQRRHHRVATATNRNQSLQYEYRSDGSN